MNLKEFALLHSPCKVCDLFKLHPDLYKEIKSAMKNKAGRPKPGLLAAYIEHQTGVELSNEKIRAHFRYEHKV